MFMVSGLSCARSFPQQWGQPRDGENVGEKEKGWVTAPRGLVCAGLEEPKPLRTRKRIPSSKGCLLPQALPSELGPPWWPLKPVRGRDRERREAGEAAFKLPPTYLLLQHLPKPQAERRKKRGEERSSKIILKTKLDQKGKPFKISVIIEQ